MKILLKLFAILLIAIDVILIIHLLTRNHNIQLFNPQGLIALQEYSIIHLILVISICIVIPVFFITFLIAWKYRKGNSHATYSPDAVNTLRSELLLWAIPTILVFSMSFITWQSTHAVDPYKAIANGVTPINVQVVALRWKWLFIYPQQHIATINQMHIPVNTPMNLFLTADDTPMNSFWVPQLSGQMYSMAGMQSQLHMLASKEGIYNGSNAEINGSGFADMKFTVIVTNQTDFTTWVTNVQTKDTPLSEDVYDQLRKPSEHTSVTYYSSVKNNLYNEIINHYMSPNSKQDN